MAQISLQEFSRLVSQLSDEQMKTKRLTQALEVAERALEPFADKQQNESYRRDRVYISMASANGITSGDIRRAALALAEIKRLRNEQ